MKNSRRAQNLLELSVETFEKRQMLAGDVSVSLSGSDLSLVGDSEANEIEISTFSGPLVGSSVNVVVNGIGSTTLNGVAAPQVFSVPAAIDGAAIVNLNVRTLKGADQVVLDNARIDGSVNISTAADRDVVKLINSEANTTSIRTGADRDTLILNQVELAGSRTDIRTGKHRDVVVIRETKLGAGVTQIRTATGADSVTLDGIEGGSTLLQILTSDQNDAVQIFDSSFGTALINSGIDGDTTLLDSVSFSGVVTAATGDGEDTVTVSATSFDSDVAINLGAGGDIYTSTGSTYLGANHVDGETGGDNFTLDEDTLMGTSMLIGGAGFDSLTASTSVFALPPTTVSFEINDLA